MHLYEPRFSYVLANIDLPLPIFIGIGNIIDFKHYRPDNYIINDH